MAADTSSDLSDELAAWVAECVDGTVVDVRRQARWRPQYFIDVADAPVDTVVLKMARAPRHVIERSRLLSTFNTNREALVLRTLRDHAAPLRVPQFLGFHEPTGSLLMAKVEGSAQLHTVHDPDRIATIATDFAAQLAALHQLDVQQLGLEGELTIPSSAEDLALGNFLQYAEADLDTVLARRPQLADPLLALARAWTYRAVPDFERRPSLVQGDCGPDQFLFDGDRVTAIIDWELAHIGDPMVDLGAMRLRECIYPAGMFPVVLDRYRALGMPTDVRAIRYYTVVTILFTLYGTIGGAVRLDPRNDEVIQQLWWQVALRRTLCEAMAEAEGIELVMPAPLADGEPADVRMQALLADRIHELAQRNAAIADEFRPTLALADAITNAQRVSPEREAANHHDLRVLLGTTPADAHAGLTLLQQRITENPADDFERTLQTLYLVAVREQEAWLPLVRADRWAEDDTDSVEGLRAEFDAVGLAPVE